MDEQQNSTEALAPNVIARVFEALTDGWGQSGTALDFQGALRLTKAAGYDWAAFLAVSDALSAGADTWSVLRVLGSLVRSRCELEFEDEPTLAQEALEMLDVCEQIRLGKVDVDDTAVRQRLVGMIHEAEASHLIGLASPLLEAAIELKWSEDSNDRSVSETLLACAARDFVHDAWCNAETAPTLKNGTSKLFRNIACDPRSYVAPLLDQLRGRLSELTSWAEG
jgi:hypothetical protein